MRSVYTTLLFCVLASLASGASIPQSHKRTNDGKYSPDKVVWYDEYHHGGGAGTPPGGGGGGGAGGDDCEDEGKDGGGEGGGGHGGGMKDPGTTDPGTKDPGTKDPGTKDPGTTDPGTKDPGTKDPGTKDPGTKDPGTTDPGTKDPGTKDPGTKDPGTTDPGTMDPDIPDPDGPDPNSEPVNPAILELIEKTENEGPYPEIIDFTDDAPDEDVSVSDTVPYDYCIPEGDGDVAQIRGPDPGQIGQDYCIDNYGDPDFRGQFPGVDDPAPQNTTTPDPPATGNDTVTRRSHFHKRTYADTGATGTMNRWRRGSVVSVCVERDDAYTALYGNPSKRFRASAIVNGATFRAINLWNKGLNSRFVSFEHVDDCRNAVFKVVAANRRKSAGSGTLATAPYPPRGETGARFREIYVWSTSFQNNYQNVLTAIMAHELGHTIGLAHENCNSLTNQPCEAITEETLTSIMRSTIANSSSIVFRGPTAADFTGTNLYYSLAAGAESDPIITLWPATRGAFITYPPIPKCKWFLGICYY